METPEARRRLVRHGMVLFMLGLFAGVAVPEFTNPRMGLSAHTATVMVGIFLLALGAVWSEIRLSSRGAAAAVWLVLYASWAASIATVLAAIFGTSGMTPIAGAGHGGEAWQEAVVDGLRHTAAPAWIRRAAIVLAGLPARPAAA